MADGRNRLEFNTGTASRVPRKTYPVLSLEETKNVSTRGLGRSVCVLIDVIAQLLMLTVLIKIRVLVLSLESRFYMRVLLKQFTFTFILKTIRVGQFDTLLIESSERSFLYLLLLRGRNGQCRGCVIGLNCPYRCTDRWVMAVCSARWFTFRGKCT